jgi:hypothetical protein
VRRLVLFIALALVASSCGGGGGSKPLSKAEFEARLGSIFREAQGKTLPAVMAVSPADPKQAVRRLKQAERSLHDAAAKLAAMKPPANAAGATSQLAAAMKRIADRVTAARKDAEEGDFARLERFKLQIGSDPAVARVRDAVVQLVNLGYNVAGPGP